MESKYVCEYGDGPYLTNLTEPLRREIDRLLDDAAVFPLIARFAPPRMCGLYLFAAAVELVLKAPGRLGIRTLYDLTGRIFGKSMETARRCMNYCKDNFDFETCNDCLFGGALSRKAFSYISVPEFIGRIAAVIVETAALRLPHKQPLYCIGF